MALDRLTQITNSGITSGITITGVNLTGVITATSANIGSGITLSGTQINVGSATTIHSGGFQIGSSDIHSTGISLNNINASGIVTATTFVGSLTGNATGLSGTPSITVATINASNATFSGNVSVAGTVTYEDVTNVDSVGIITARSGIVIGSGTSISSPATNVLTLGTNNTEAIRINSSGNLGVGTANPQYPIHLFKTSYPELNIGTGTVTATYGIDTGTNTVVLGSTTNHPFSIVTAGSERVRITAAGNFGLGTASPQHKLSVYGTGAVRNEIVCTDNNSGGAGVYLRTLNSGTQVSNATLRTTNSGAFEVYTGTSSETIKLSIDTSGNLITTSNIGSGLDVGYKKFVTITGSFAANTWYNTGIDRTTDTGIYLLNAYVDTYNTGQSYQMSYIGWFVMPNRATNSGSTSDITLHRAGHAPNGEVIQFRTLLTPAASDSKIYLQWLSNFNLTLNGGAGNNIQVAIHRFGTAFNN